MRNEIAKFREMNAAEKRWYIWEYYKFPIAIFVLLVLLIGSFANAWLNPRAAEYLYVAWDGPSAHSHQLDALADALAVIAPEDGRVTVTNYTLTDNSGINSALQARFVALLHLGEMDIYITTPRGAAELASADYSRPVGEMVNYLAEINPDINLRDRLRTANTADYMAISLEGSPLLAQIGIASDDVYLAIFTNTTRLPEIARALEVLLYEG